MIVCDRCKVDVTKLVEESTCLDGTMTMGYYQGGPASPWKRFMNESEMILCDYCMWADPRYIAVYGDWCAKEHVH